jgi:hypothetical protein
VATLTLTVTRTPDFSLAASPTLLTIPQGESKTTTVTITRTNFTAAVSLVLLNAPSGISATFAPPSTTGNTSTATISVDANMMPGQYQLTVQGTAALLPARTTVVQANVVVPSPVVLFQDDFTVLGTKLDLSKWTTEFDNAAMFGRTTLADWVRAGGVGQFVVGPDGAQVALNTFNPTASPANRNFYGTHGKTLQLFQPTGNTTIVYTARLRLETLQPGIVFGVYLLGCQPATCATSHDEIDIELMTNELQGAPFRVQLNRYANDPFGPGHGRLVALPANFSALDWHVWTIKWSRTKIEYLVDGVLLGAETTFVPQGAMHVDVNAWAPDTDWLAAYSASLVPDASSAANRRFYADLRSVEVTSVP